MRIGEHIKVCKRAKVGIEAQEHKEVTSTRTCPGSVEQSENFR